MNVLYSFCSLPSLHLRALDSRAFVSTTLTSTHTDQLQVENLHACLEKAAHIYAYKMMLLHSNL